MDDRSFGAPYRHYAQKEFWSADDWTITALRDSLKKTIPDLEKQVENTCLQWNRTIREQTRKETGLSLSWETRQVNIPVKIKYGLPIPLANALEDFHHPVLWDLLINRSQFVQAGSGLALIERKYENLKDVQVSRSPPSPNHIHEVSEYIKALVEMLDDVELPKIILGIEEDTMGAYYFCVPEVHIYWMAIGLISILLGLSVRELTLITLTHELAHAYCHLGFDIDGSQWDTSAFANSDLYIVEGLAQYYTRLISINLLDRLPNLIEVFGELLMQQSRPYYDFADWEVIDAQQEKEIVRFGMLTTRARNICNYDEFLYILGQAQQQIIPD